MAAAVELKDVTRRYGAVDAVAGVSLAIRPGEFVALLGPSGCGKTTTLQMLAGFVEPTSGEILVDGRSMRGIPSYRRNIGVVFQSYALFPHLTVFDNVAFGLRMRGVAAAEIARRVAHAIELVQLGALDARYPRELSGGQQQRVALARALVIEPSVLLLDEPLSNLDANLREQMRFEIREIQQRIGITTVFVTHDQSEAMAVADRLVVMAKGRIHQAGSVREIYESPADAFVAGFIGQANLIRGRVIEAGEGAARFEIPGQRPASVRTGGPLRAGDEALLCLRPEDLRLSGPAGTGGTAGAAGRAAGVNAVVARVKRVTYLGSQINVGAMIGDTAIAVLLPRSEPAPAVGDAVCLTWSPLAGALFPRARA